MPRRSWRGDVGLALHLMAGMAILSVLVAVLAGDTWAVTPLAVCGGGALVAGQVLHRRFRRAREHATRTAVAVVASAWVVTGLLAAVVLWWLGTAGAAHHVAITVHRDPLTALFEGVSGITSTGPTMADGLESALPATVQWWRTFASVAALWAAGLDGWTALNHGMTAIDTGGFTITPDSFASHPSAARIVGMEIILVGATSFVAL